MRIFQEATGRTTLPEHTYPGLPKHAADQRKSRAATRSSSAGRAG